VKTAISVPDHVFEAAEELARRLGVSRSELYSSAVAQFLEENRSIGVTALLDQVYSEEDSKVGDDIMALQLDALPEETW
jgi:metal-responsive CopG/Arc/MetJ family transcriptional regulator